MNSYNLSRQWFAFAYYHSNVKPVHTALYFWIIERANSSGWKKLLDIQTEKSMECLGITDWRTYKNALQFLVDSGFILWIEKSRNQFTCNRISLVENAFELSEALKTGNAQNVKANAQNAEAIAEAIAEAYAEADVEAIAEALQSYINLKTNKPTNHQTPKEEEEGVYKRGGLLLAFQTKEFAQAFDDFLNFRIQKDHPVVEASYKDFFMELLKLANRDEKTAIKILRQSIARGWKNIYELKKSTYQNGSANNKNRTNGSGNNSSGAELAYAIAS